MATAPALGPGRLNRVPAMPRNDLVLRAARGEQTPITPIWLMRQAGRTDPAYRQLREEVDLPLEDLFRSPELAARITLLPRRLGVDALIVFQDILTPLGPSGCEFIFAPGPVLAEPVRMSRHVEALRVYDMAEGLPFVAETFRLVHDALQGELPVLGFAGAPFTLAVFLIEGRSPGDSPEATRRFMAEEPEAFRQLLDKLTELTIDYLKFQAASGAAALQLFESAANLLSADKYRTYALPCQQRIFEALRGVVSTIVFARECADVELLAASGADVVSLPSSVSIAEARAVLGPEHPLQGNLDNQLLAHATFEEVAAAAQQCVAEGGHRGHIFNLSHGLLPDTPYEHLQRLVDVVHAARAVV